MTSAANNYSFKYVFSFIFMGWVYIDFHRTFALKLWFWIQGKFWTHHHWRRLLEADQELFLRQAQPFSSGFPKQDLLHPRRRTPLRPQPHPVIIGLQPLIAVRTQWHVLQQVVDQIFVYLLLSWNDKNKSVKCTASLKITAANISLIKKWKDKTAIEKVNYIYVSPITLGSVSSIKNQSEL